jgi:two-component system, OmpR family, phosphate regulon response regulator PhoB
MAQVLLVDDEPDLLSVLDFNLRAAGLDTSLVTTGEDVFEHVRRRVPDLVLLDLMLPDISGVEVCRRLKAEERTRHVPVIMLTAKTGEVDRVVGLEVGADDYVTKPYSVRELVLRVKAVLRRVDEHRPGERRSARVGPVRVDVDAHRAYVDGEKIQLTPLEFDLLHTLVARAGRVQTREQLLENVWDLPSDVETRTIDTHVKRLREKLGSARDLLETVRGVGYRLAHPDDT